MSHPARPPQSMGPIIALILAVAFALDIVFSY